MVLTSLQKLLQGDRSVKKLLREIEANLKDFSDPAATALANQIEKDRKNLRASRTALDLRKALDVGLTGQDMHSGAMQTFDMLAAEIRTSTATSGAESLATYFGGAAVFALVAFLLVLMLIVFRNAETLQLLGQIPVARGLITFTVTIGTIGVALAMIGAMFISQAEDLKERLSLGNQVLTALIAVLGTIVGFYYGTSDGGSGSNPSQSPQEFSVTSQSISPETLGPGDTLTVAATIEGGVVPYAVTVRLEEAGSGNLIVEEARQVAGALALIPLQIPNDATGQVELELRITDADGQEIDAETVELQIETAE